VRAQCENATFEFGSSFFRGERRTRSADYTLWQIFNKALPTKTRFSFDYCQMRTRSMGAKKGKSPVDFQGFQIDRLIDQCNFADVELTFPSRDLGEREFVA
jgi:hypothetical protein